MAHTLIAFKEEVSALLLLVFFKCILSKVCLSKVYFCEMYPTCVSSKLCEFIFSLTKVEQQEVEQQEVHQLYVEQQEIEQRGR